MTNRRYFQTTGGTKFREFGVLETVDTNSWGLHITNTEGHQVGMKKIYYDWANVALKAKRAIGSSVIIETGRSGDTHSVFRDIYTSGDGILGTDIMDFPDDTGDEGKSKLLWARCRVEQLTYERHYLREEKMELRDKIENLTRSEKEAQDAAAAKLNEVFDDWLKDDPNKVFRIVAAAAGDKKLPDKLDKAFALRLGVNTMKKKRINVIVKKRTYNNNINVLLPDNDNRKVQMALTLGNTKATAGDWCVQTVMNNVSGFQKVEEELFPDWRSSRKPIEYYLKAHDTVLNALVDRG